MGYLISQSKSKRYEHSAHESSQAGRVKNVLPAPGLATPARATRALQPGLERPVICRRRE